MIHTQTTTKEDTWTAKRVSDVPRLSARSPASASPSPAKTHRFRVQQTSRFRAWQKRKTTKENRRVVLSIHTLSAISAET